MKNLSHRRPEQSEGSTKNTRRSFGLRLQDDRHKKVLLIAGFDPTGNAGILRDAAVCRDLNIPYVALITAMALQNDKKYFGTKPTPIKDLELQWQNLNLKEFATIKIGMIPDLAIAKFLVSKLKTVKAKIIWDPVLASSSGGELISKSGFEYARKHLTPLVDLITPNAEEACRFLNVEFNKNYDGREIASAFFDTFQTPVYLKGGHLKSVAEDYLIDDKNNAYTFEGEPSRKKIRGTGCFFATQIACHLAITPSLLEACQKAKTAMDAEFKK